jgi:hypothetical protein
MSDAEATFGHRFAVDRVPQVGDIESVTSLHTPPDPHWRVIGSGDMDATGWICCCATETTRLCGN